MPKISDKIKEAEAAHKPFIAFEFFPPRTPEGLENLYKRCTNFAAQGK